MKFLFQSFECETEFQQIPFANPLEFRWHNSGMAIYGSAMKWNTRVFGAEKGVLPAPGGGCTQFRGGLEAPTTWFGASAYY